MGGVPGPRGMSAPGGCTWSRGVSAWGVSAQGCLLGGGVVLGGAPGPRGVTTSGGCLLPGGCTWSRGLHLPRYPPVNRILDRRL